jgi:hypothetical protein
VGDIELLTSDLSNKIWQKITIIETLPGDHAPHPPARTQKPSPT